MPDLTDLLERAASADVAPLDYDQIITTVRRRRHRRRNLLAVGVSVVAIALATVTLAVRKDPGAPPTRDTAIADDPALTQPIGTWHQASPSPLGARDGAFTATLSDSRVLVLGGRGRQGAEGAITEYDGAIYDLDTDQWETIPEAPIPAGTSIHWVQFAEDRLVALGSDTDGNLNGAMFDVTDSTWTPLPHQTQVRVLVNGMAWDGDNLAIVRTAAGGTGMGENQDLDWAVPQPVTLRWSRADSAWRSGAPAPFGLRTQPGAAFDGQRLALLGGTTQNPSLGDGTIDGTGVLGDGAIYDLHTDQWTAVPPSPASTAVSLTAAWQSDGRLVTGGGFAHPGGDDQHKTLLAIYDPATNAWSEPETVLRTGLSVTNPWTARADETQTMLAFPNAHTTTDTPSTLVLGPDGWEVAPFPTIRQVGTHLVAVSARRDNPGDNPLTMSIRAESNVWVTTVIAPFTNRMDAAIAVSGDRLLITGGYEGARLTPTATTWVFDLDGDRGR
jgi:hypothetical protein